MDQFEERKKKLEAAKEKLAAFQKKKKSRAKTSVSNNDGRDECSQQNGDEHSPPEVSSPSAFSVTDSDQFSFTSGDEWSAEESDQKSPVHCQPNLTDVKQKSEDSSESAWDPVVPLSDTTKHINISDVEFALAKRDELINKLTQSLQSSLGQNIPNDDVMSQVHSLAEHILTLQSQLQQADQSLQEQLELHESSALALQSAKEQMLQLQVIINYKDAELKKMFKLFENNSQVIQSLQMKEAHTEKSLNEVHIICEQYFDKIKTLEGELHKKMLDVETFTSSQQEWIAREHELKSLLSAKSEEVNTLLESHRMTAYEKQPQQEENTTTDQELLKVLESQLEELRRENEFGASEISMLRKRNTELEVETHDYARQLSDWQSWSKEYESLSSQHSQSLSQIDYLASLNSELQDKLSSLSFVEKDFAALSSEYKKLQVNYQEQVQKTSLHSESDSYAEQSATFSIEKETLNTKIMELQNELAKFQTTSKSVDTNRAAFQQSESENFLEFKAQHEKLSELKAQHSAEIESLNTKIVEYQAEIARLQAATKSSDDDVKGSHSLVAQLQQELQQKDDYLKGKLYEIAEMQVMLHGLRSSYENVENTLVSNDEAIASLTDRLQESEHANKAADLDEVVSQKLKLEHTVAGLQHRLQEKDLECRQYTENIVKLQDELLSAQHANDMEMSEKEHQFESIEEHMTVLNSKKAKLAEKVKELEHRLQTECQQYMDALQHVMAEKEMECKQYTENIVALQDELLSVRHAHGVEVSEKEYQFERIEEQMEMLSAERVNLALKVKDLELRLNLAQQQQSQNDLKQVNIEIDSEGTNYTENIVLSQDELISTEHIHDLQLLENKGHLEQSGKQLEFLEKQRATLSDKVTVLELELIAETELRKEMQEARKAIETQLQGIVTDREALLKSVESLTTEIQFLKKELHDTNVEKPLNYESQDVNMKQCVRIDETENIGDVETVKEKVLTTNDHSNTHEILDIPYSQNIDLTQDHSEPHSPVLDIISELEYQQKLVIHHQAETEQLKAKISVMNFNEDLRQTQAVLQTLTSELVKAQSEFTKHTESILNRLQQFEIYEQETQNLQKELLEIKAVSKLGQEKELGQEELQAQLEITISQWQRLQLIVQEKEIELHKLQESLDEQKRICTSMRKTHEEQRGLLQAEIDALKLTTGQHSTAIQGENKLFELQTSLENKSYEIHQTKNFVREDQVTATSLHDGLIQKEAEISNLKTLLSVKECENSQQENNLNVLQKIIADLKVSLSESQSQVTSMEEKLQHTESEVEVLKDSLYGSIKEKELEIINFRSTVADLQMEKNGLQKILSDSQAEVNDLKCSLTALAVEEDGLKKGLANKEIDLQVDELKSSLTNKDSEIDELKSSLTNKESEIDELKSSLTNKDSEIDELKSSLTNKDSEIDELKSSLTNKESEIDELKSSLTNKESEIDELKSSLTNKESEIDELKSSLTNKDSEIDELKSSLTNKESDIDELKTSLTNKDSEIDELKSSLTNKESEIDGLKSSLTNKESDIDELKTSLTNKESEIDELKSSLTNKESEIETLKCNLTNKESENDVLVASLADREEEIISVRSSFSGIKSEIEVCKSYLINKDLEVTTLLCEAAEGNYLKSSDRDFSVLKSSQSNNEHENATLKDIPAGKAVVEINMLKGSSPVDDKPETDTLVSSHVDRTTEMDDMMKDNAENKIDVATLTDSLYDKEEVINDLKTTLNSKVVEMNILENENADIKVKIGHLESKLSNRDSDLEKALTALKEKELEIHHFRENLLNIEMSLQSYRMGHEEKDSELETRKKHIEKMELETSTLRIECAKKDSDINNMKDGLVEKESEIDQLKMIIAQKNEEIGFDKNALSGKNEEIIELRHELLHAQSVASDLERDLAFKSTERDMLVMNLVDKDLEVDSLRSSLMVNGLKMSSLINNLNEREFNTVSLLGRVEERETEIRSIRSILTEKDMELVETKSSLDDRESELAETKSQLAELEQESHSLQSLLTEKDLELAETKSQLTGLEQESNSLQSLLTEKDSELAETKSELSELYQESNSLHSLLTEKDSELAETKSELSGLYQESNSLQSLLTEKDSELAETKSDLAGLYQESNSLQSLLTEKDSELAETKSDLAGLYQESNSLQSLLTEKDLELAETKSQLSGLYQESNSLQSLLTEKDSELAETKSELSGLYQESNSLQSLLTEKDSELAETKYDLAGLYQESNSLQSLLTEKDSELAETKSDLAGLYQESNSLQSLLTEKDSELAETKSDLAELYQENHRLQSLLTEKDLELAETKSQLAELEQESHSLHSSLTDKDLELAETKSSLDVRESELAETKSLLAELELESCSLQSSLTEKETEVHELQLRISEKESEVIYFKNSFTNRDSEITDVKSSFEEKESEVNDLQSKVNETLSEMEKLQGKLNEREEELSLAVQSKIDIHAELDNIKLQMEDDGTEAKRDFAQKTSEIAALRERLTESESQVDVLRTTLGKAEEQLLDVNNSVIIKESEISDSTDRLNEAAKQLDELQTRVAEKDRELADVRESAVEREYKISILGEELLETSNHVDRLNTILANTNKELAAVKASVLEKETEICTNASHSNETLLALNLTLAEKDLEIDNLTESLKEACDQVDLLQISLSNADEELRAVKNEAAEKEFEIKSLTGKVNSIHSQAETVHVSLSSANEELTAVKDSLMEKELKVCVMEKELISVNSQVEKLHTSLISTNQELAAVTSSVLNKDAEICALKVKLDEASEKESEINLLTEKLGTASSQVETLQATLTSTNEELASLRTAVVEKDSKICVLNEELSNASGQLMTLNAALISASEEMTAVKSSVVEKESEICAMKDCTAEKESELSGLSQRLSEATSELDTLHKTLNNTSEELKAVQASLMDKESAYTVLEVKLNDLYSQNETLQSLLHERDELLRSVTDEKNALHAQVLSLQSQLEALEVNLNEVRAENSVMKGSLHNNQGHNESMQSIITHKESELASLTTRVTDLEQEVKTLFEDLETAKTVEVQLKMDLESNEKKFELTREKDLQDWEAINKSVTEKETTIAELIQSVVDITAAKKQLMEELSGAERNRHILEVALSNLTQDDHVKCDIIVHQESLLQDQADKLLALTDTLNTNGIELEEIKESNKSLQELNDELVSKSHMHLNESAHQREAIEQQVRAIEDLLAQKESEISVLAQSVAYETANKDELTRQLLTVETNYRSLLGLSSHLQEDIMIKEATLFDQKVIIDDQSLRLDDLSQELAQGTLSMNDLNASLKSQIDVLQECKCDLEQRISKLQDELDNQEITTTQFMVEGKQINEKLTLLTHDLETKEATIFDLRHDCDMYLKEINDLKQELEQKDLLNISLKEEVESVHGSLERSKEEKEMLKANFDSCMEEMQQRFGDQELQMKRLRSQLAEETNSVNQDQTQMKEIYEHQIGQLEEKLIHYEKQCERLEKELTEVKAKSSTAKEVYEHQLSEQELHLQSTNSELVRLKDHLTKITTNHKCEVAGLRRLYEIQTNELEESCVTLERTVSEQKRFINESTHKFNREKNDLDQSYEIQLNDVEEKRRLGELEICRLKKHLDEMKLDHERDMQSLEKSYEARLYELEDKYCSSTNELERLRKSLMCTTGNYSEERNALEARVEELEAVRRDLQNRNAALEDDIVSLRDQAHHREDEMKEVLKNAAETQQEKTTDMTSEISQLQQQLLICSQEQAEAIAEIKREYEAQVLDLQFRNKQLVERNCSLEVIIEDDLSLQNKKSTVEVTTPLRHSTVPAHESTSQEKRLASQKCPERSSGVPPDDEPVCTPYSHTSSFSDNLHSESANFDECFSPADNEGPIIEGFVAEPTVTYSQQRKASHPKISNIYKTSIEKSDFVEEQCRDEFQPEITVDISGQDSDHPIHEVVVRERFEPETTDRFLIESAEIDNSLIWQHELSVGMSLSHLQAQGNLDFRTLDQLHTDEELCENDVQRRDDSSTDFNSNCSTRDVRSASSSKLDTTDDRFEKHLNHIREELEEEYVTKMRQQQIQLTIEYERKQTEYKTEMEQHFAQRMKAVKYEWERKFNKALLKVKKEMEERQISELRQFTPEGDSIHQHSVSPVKGEEQDLIPNVTEGSEILNEAVDVTLKENHELADPSDVFHGQEEIGQTRDQHSEVQHELQVIFTNRESVSSVSSTATTLTLNGSPPATDTEIDEADSCRSEVSETNSAKERFLEELEDISHQSCQDLPLEWELTSTVIESGNFEQEPEHHSVWEVFDGRCVRQDCQEVRHKFRKLYQWVVKHKGDGFDVVLDGELQVLMASADFQNDSNYLLKLPQVTQPEINSVHSCDGAAGFGKISHADLLARVLSLESDKHKLEEKLLVQIHCNSTIRREMQQYEAIHGQLQEGVNAGLYQEDEMFKFKNIQNEAILQQRSFSSGELEDDFCEKETSLSHKSSDYQSNNSVSTTVEAVEDHGQQDEHTPHFFEMAIHNLHKMLIEKEEQIVLMKQENENLKSYIDKFVIETTLPEHNTERLGVLQQQLQVKQQLLEMKDIIIRNLQTDPTSPQQTDSALTDGSGDSTKQDNILDLKLNVNSLSQINTEPSNDTSTSLLEEKDMHVASAKHSYDRSSDESSKEVSECEESSCQEQVHLPHSDVSPAKEYESAASSSSDIYLDTLSLDDSHIARSRSETPDLEDKAFAKEISRLHKDIQDTKEIYCKENVLLQEAFNKGTALKNRTVHRQISYKEITAETSVDDSELALLKTEDDTEMLKQKLDICLKQNQMLEDENAILRKRVRLQAAKIIIFKKSTLQNKSQETAEWRQSFSVQLAAIHKQRNDLIQLISDMDAGKESKLSDSLHGTLKKDSLRQVQEDLVARVEELDHLYKMLTQRQVELQHCDAERRHLEQLCLLKDETEMQLMKQKRLMEEQLSEIEFHLRERETILIEEKTQLLQELKEGKISQSWVLTKKQNSAQVSFSELLPQSSLAGSGLSSLALGIAHHSSSAETSTPSSATNLDHQHLEAIERLRTKLKHEYGAHTTRVSDSQTSLTTSHQEGQNKQV